MRLRNPIVCVQVACLVVSVLVLSAPAAHAATFVVDTTIDAPDAASGDGLCLTATATCSLRAAVQTANDVAGPDVITLPAGTYTLTIPNDDEELGAEDDLDVRDPLTINGAGDTTTIIDGGGFKHVFEVQLGSLELSDLTVRHGQNGIASDRSLTLTRVIVTDNGNPGGGGGVVVRSPGGPTTCLVTDSTISNNHSTSNGGGIYGYTISPFLTLTIQRSVITGNDAINGGGVYAAAVVTIDETTITGNSAIFGGGFLTPTATLTMTRSTVSGNSASLDAGGVAASGSGTIENTTISGNMADRHIGGLTGGGGPGIRIRNVTITGNVADADGNGDGDGGGFMGSNEISNSIVSGNIDLGGEADDCNGTITSGGFNLIENGTCFISGTLTGNVLGLPAALGPLAMNGGPTATHALLAGSPAVDAGNPALPGSEPTACATTDQRSVLRPHATACDVGAVEEAYVVSTCGNGTLDGGEQCDDGNVRAGDCCSATCQFDGPGALCTDGDVCTDDVCDGAGACAATNNTAPCNDGVFCTGSDTCGGGACVGGPPPSCDDGSACTNDVCNPSGSGFCQHLPQHGLCDDGDPCTYQQCSGGSGSGCSYLPVSSVPCDDGNACTTTDVCQAGTCFGHGQQACDDCLACDPVNGCSALAPEPTCHPAPTGKSILQLKDVANPAADALRWDWKADDGTPLDGFGSPTTSTTYDLCVYDASAGPPSLLLKASPAVGMCGAKPCWKTTVKKHEYNDHTRAADGLTGIKLQSVFPTARISVKGKGVNLPALGLPLAPDPTLVVQLRASNGGCWGATFSAPSSNTAERFKAKSD